MQFSEICKLHKFLTPVESLTATNVKPDMIT